MLFGAGFAKLRYIASRELFSSRNLFSIGPPFFCHVLYRYALPAPTAHARPAGRARRRALVPDNLNIRPDQYMYMSTH